MIKVFINNDNNKIYEICIHDHADDKFVCAAVSSIFYGIANTISVKKLNIFVSDNKKFTTFEVNEKKHTSHEFLIMDSLHIQLKTISQKYPSDLKIIYTQEEE